MKQLRSCDFHCQGLWSFGWVETSSATFGSHVLSNVGKLILKI